MSVETIFVRSNRPLNRESHLHNKSPDSVYGEFHKILRHIGAIAYWRTSRKNVPRRILHNIIQQYIIIILYRDI